MMDRIPFMDNLLYVIILYFTSIHVFVEEVCTDYSYVYTYIYVCVCVGDHSWILDTRWKHVSEILIMQFAIM